MLLAQGAVAAGAVVHHIKRGGISQVRFDTETKLSPLAPDDTAKPETLALISAICEAGLTAGCSVQSFDWRSLQLVQREAPETRTTCATAQQCWLDKVSPASTAPDAPAP